MQYPLISEYVTAIRDFNYHSSGAFAVVFKMIDEVSGEL